MKLLGVDPGFSIAGFGIIESIQNKVILLDAGFLRLPAKESLPYRVDCFYRFFLNKIMLFHPDGIVLETSFLGKNAQNFLKLGYLRGVLYLLASQHKLELLEFAPSEIKRALTGYGGAGKDQVARVIMSLFPHLKPPEKYDVTDALAISLCGLWRGTGIYSSFLH